MKKLIFVLIAALGVSCASYAQMSEKELKKATYEEPSAEGLGSDMV